MENDFTRSQTREPWNKGKVIGQKRPLKLKEIWGIRTLLESAGNSRELALFNLALDSKLRASDLVQIRIRDVAQENVILKRATVVQKKTGTPVQFEITEQTRKSISTLIFETRDRHGDYLFKSAYKNSAHLSTRQYSRIVKRWVSSIGLQVSDYATHSLRRTKPTLIYKETKNLRAIQLLLGHTKPESTVRYLGIEVDDALEISEKIEI